MRRQEPTPEKHPPGTPPAVVGDGVLVDGLSALDLLTSIDIPTLVLNAELRVVSFNPPIRDLFKIREDALGRRISEFTLPIDYQEISTDAEHVLVGSAPVQREVQDEAGRWYLTRMLPYRSGEDRIKGVVITCYDITDRKRAEEAVNEARIYAESIVETIHEPLLVLTPDLRVQSANPAFFDHFEVKEADTIGTLIYELGNGQWDIPDLRTLLEDVLPDDEVFNDFVVRHEFEDIGERTMLVNARRLDHVQLILLGIRDITERTKSEEELHQSEEHHRLIVEGALDYAIFTSDPDGTLESWSPGAEAVFGWTADEVIGHPLAMTFTPEDREAGVPDREREIAGREGIAPDVRWHLRKDGSRVFLDGSMRALTDGDGGVRGFLKIGQDVTARREAEQALLESERRFRQLSEAVPDIVFTTNPDGVVDYVSPRREELTGQPPENALGTRMWPEVIHPEDRPRAEAARDAAFAETVPFESRYRLALTDGTYRWFITRARPIGGEDGGVERWFGTLTDVDDLTRAEMELQDLNATLEERVQNRTQEVRRLAATLSMAEQEERRRIARILHDDLQQLLFGVHLRLEFLREDVQAFEAEKVTETFEQARDWVSEAITITRQLAVDLNPPILKDEGLSDALSWLRSQMHEKHRLSVHLDIDPDVRVDDADIRSLLFQSVRELLFNVVKHAGSTSASVSVQPNADGVRIVVADDGVGFDVTSQTRQSTGFGLVSIRERLHLIGGILNIESAAGSGTRVTLHAPLQ